MNISYPSAISLPPGVKRKGNISGSKLTTYGIGGPIPNLVEIEEESVLSEFLVLLNQHRQPYRILGAGSNLLIPDQGVTEWVIKLGRALRYWLQVTDNEFIVGGAMPLITLSQELSALGYSGLEFAGGIPASVGGATYMNAGAHGSNMSEIITEVTLVNPQGEIKRLGRTELKFSYRRSYFEQGAIVTKIRICLQPAPKAEVLKTRAEFLSHRKKVQPISVPSSGSIFKNPESSDSAGILIEKAGLKGRSFGGAKVSEKHGNWIVNEKRTATARDVLEAIRTCQEEVKRRFGITLDPELVIW